MTRSSIREFSQRCSQRELILCGRLNHWVCRRALWRYFAMISRLGDGIFWYLLAALLVLFGGKAGLQATAHMLAVAAATLVLYKWLKRTSRRQRPAKRRGDLILRVAPLDEFSFPSGHTLHAVAFTVVALAYFPFLFWLLIPFSLSVAASRVVLGLHYPSDVLAATALGLFVAELSFLLVP